jgi:hypothetical protein
MLMRRVGASYERCGKAKMQGVRFEKLTDHRELLSIPPSRLVIWTGNLKTQQIAAQTQKRSRKEGTQIEATPNEAAAASNPSCES